ncbi:MAG: capsule biosynthesis protein, partial [Sphingomonas sp.]|nr:capsule biosynthesis protein [Sphingomonas sp.]
MEAEDGFIRSIGLGADCIPPLSLVVDRLGIYFDPNQPSELETLLQKGTFPPELTQRARRLRTLMVDLGVSKYAVGQRRIAHQPGRQLCVLVPGQVEDDRSVLCGGGVVTSNLELLRRARQHAPGAHIIYKPHPDVEAGHRVGAIAAR